MVKDGKPTVPCSTHVSINISVLLQNNSYTQNGGRFYCIKTVDAFANINTRYQGRNGANASSERGFESPAFLAICSVAWPTMPAHHRHMSADENMF